MVVVRGRDYQDANGCRRRLRWKIPGPPASPLPPSNICQPLLLLHPSSSYQRAAGSSRECHDDRTEWRRSHHRGQPLPCNWLTMVSASCRPLSRSNFFFFLSYSIVSAVVCSARCQRYHPTHFKPKWHFPPRPRSPPPPSFGEKWHIRLLSNWNFYPYVYLLFMSCGETGRNGRD